MLIMFWIFFIRCDYYICALQHFEYSYNKKPKKKTKIKTVKNNKNYEGKV